MEKIQFIMISYEELVSLLIMSGYNNGIAGFQVPEFDLSEEEQKAYALSNIPKLIESKFAVMDENEETLYLDKDVAHLLHVLMNHQFAYIMVRMIPSKDFEEKVVYDICGEDILEHMGFSNGMHRFAIIPTKEHLYARIRKLVPITDVRTENMVAYTIAEKSFSELIDQVKGGETAIPLQKLMEAGMNQELAENCISGIRNPELTTAIMGIVYEDQLAVKVSSISVYANNESLWGIWPVEQDEYKNIPEEKEVALFECTQSDVVSFFKNWVDLLDTSNKTE